MKNEQGDGGMKGRLSLEVATGNILGDTRIKLLEAIEKHGSISQAAKAVPLSYKAAWDAVDVMNNLAPEPVVVSSTGGKQGGGTALTPYARKLIAFYRALEEEYQATIDRVSGRVDMTGADGVADIAAFRSMMKRMAMRTSARNQFAGTIEAILHGEVGCEIRLRLDDSLTMVALVSQESAETMGLEPGMEVQAFVKSSSILLVDGDGGKLSARNHFEGEVVRIHQGPVNAEVTIALPGGRHAVTATITQQSMNRMGIVSGKRLSAVFKASSVLLAFAD